MRRKIGESPIRNFPSVTASPAAGGQGEVSAPRAPAGFRQLTQILSLSWREGWPWVSRLFSAAADTRFAQARI